MAAGTGRAVPLQLAGLLDAAGSVLRAAHLRATRAVKQGHVYCVPHLPFNWFDRPPSVNLLIGLRWTGHLVYPEVFDYDMRAETRRFYRLFYQIDLNDAQVDALLARSTRQQ